MKRYKTHFPLDNDQRKYHRRLFIPELSNWPWKGRDPKYGWVIPDETLFNKNILINLDQNPITPIRENLLWFLYYSEYYVDPDIVNKVSCQIVGYDPVIHLSPAETTILLNTEIYSEEEFYKKYCINFSEWFWICTNDRGIELYLDSLSEYKREWIKERF